MAASVGLVISSKPGSTAMPDWSTEFTLLIRVLQKRGILGNLEQHGPTRRSDAADMTSILLFLVAFFCYGGKGGLRGCSEHIGRWRTRLAAVAGRKTLPSSSAVSRTLAALAPEQVQSLQRALLADSLSNSLLPGHRLAVWSDAWGQAWCVVDLDPTVLAVRQRALPEGEDLPQAHRRAEGFAAPGYPGRHRGEVVLSACRTQFSGSGLWCSVSLAAGNTPMALAVAAATEDIARVCNQLKIPLDRTVIRIDGAGGTVPCVTVVQASGLHFLTRSARYRLLTEPDVAQWLAQAPWQPVEDSGSGPRREAAELGTWLWLARKQTRRPDGGAYEPVSPRMVVSRFRPTDPERKHGAGVLIDGWHYELFACDLDALAWPAAATVALYYGRAELENRFGQENRELSLDRIFSHSLPGQALATAVGMFVWNQRIERGAQLASIQPDFAFAATLHGLPAPQPALLSISEVEAPPPPAPPGLDELDWDAALSDRPGWSCADERHVQCPAGKTLLLHRRVEAAQGRVRLIFRARKGACGHCPIRQACSASTDTAFRREISVTLAPKTPAPQPQARAPVWRPPPSQPTGRPMQPPRLVPSELRHQWTRLTANIETRVHLHLPPPPPSLPPWIAPDAAHRQHRRKTWAQRRAFHELPDSASVLVELRHPDGPVGAAHLGAWPESAVMLCRTGT